LPVYVFNYIGDNVPQLGLMADEVKELHPDAIIKMGEFDGVLYHKAVL